MDDNTEHEFKQGDKVKNLDNTNWEEPYSRAVITNTLDNQEGEIEIMPLEGKAKGETQVKELDDIAQLKQKEWLCIIGRSYGASADKPTAVRNALQHRSVDEEREEPVKVWLAEVDETNWKIRGVGSVYSTFIDNEQEFEIEPDLAREIGDRAEDTISLVYSALEGSEPYREGLNYKVMENKIGL
jgi:Uma2 family endonuclease